MSLIILRNTISSTNSVASHSTWVNAKGTCSISITCISNVLMIHLFKWLTSMMLLSIEIVHSSLLSSIALPDVLHEVSIVHSISHLCLVVSAFIWSLRIGESSYSCLIKHLLLLIHLSVHMWQHLMNPRVISRLEQNSMMRSVHFINTQRSITSSITSSLLSHSISHEKCLIWLLSTKPINRNIDYKTLCNNNLLTFHWFFK